MPTTTIGGLPPFPADARSEPLPSARLRTAHRLAEQAWGNLRYERPALATALIAAPALAALMANYGGV